MDTDFYINFTFHQLIIKSISDDKKMYSFREKIAQSLHFF